MNANSDSRILVVDDNPATLYATGRVIRAAGFGVLEADTGAAAVTAATTQPVDLVVLDIDLPDLDGYEVCRQIRATPESSTVRVVYLSATFVDDSHRVEGFEAGADAFLTHPVEPMVLVATIRSLLRTRAIELQLEGLLQREREVREQAERANRSKDEFLATLSHELRSPLNAIIGWAEVARLRATSDDVRQALRVVVRNARFQTQLISDLLDVSRITLGKMELSKETIDIAELVSTTVESLRSMAEEAGVTVDLDVQKGIGPLEADPVRVQQMISNLLSNAMKFSVAGGKIRIGVRREADNVVLTVSDDGRGIESTMLPLLFDRFWQEDTSSKRTHSGLGLGLAIVKHVALMHGGSVRAESAGLGKGAQFTVTLPLVANARASATPIRAHGAYGLSTDLRGLRVLVVDDDEDARRWVKQVLVDAGAETLEVSDVAVALEAVEEFRPHVLVSDLAMPVQDGFDLVGFIRTRGHSPATLPAIALSAFAGPEHKHRALAASYQLFLSKPPEPRDLLTAVATLGASRKPQASGEFTAQKR